MAPAGADGAVVPAGELIATISHELRQPLASIRGFTEMLLSHWPDFPDDDKIEMLKEILHDAIRLGRLVDELLDVSRLGRGALPLRRLPTEVAEVVARAVANLKLSYPGLDVIVEMPGPAPVVMADPFKLEQVVTNIVDNSLRHGGARTVRVNASYQRAPGGERRVEVAITDDGTGIRPDELPHVTEKFFRSAGSETGGLGLGLWISKGIVEAHGGELVATSGPGRGTTVRFTVAVDGDDLAPAGTAGTRTGAGDGETAVQGQAGTGKLAGS
jgi:signal transduction histidine kinase